MKRLVIVLCLALAACKPPPDHGAKAVAGNLVTAKPAWLFKSDVCPADIMSEKWVQFRYDPNACKKDADACAKRCENGDANDCFSLALAVEPVQGGTPAMDALLMRACALGIVNACSSRAANMSSDAVACQVRTYEKACDRYDPWACSVFGMHLARGIGIERDLDRAREVIHRSCDLVDDDNWCAQEFETLGEIDRMEKQQRNR